MDERYLPTIIAIWTIVAQHAATWSVENDPLRHAIKQPASPAIRIASDF